MNYKYVTDKIVAKIDEDGKSRMSCTVENPEFIRWVSEGNTPLPVDPPTAEELAAAAERQAQKGLLLEAKASAMFDTLKGATLTQIDNWVDTNFAAMTVQQRRLLKLLTAATSLYLRERT